MQRRKEPYGEDGLVTMLIPARAVDCNGSVPVNDALAPSLRGLRISLRSCREAVRPVLTRSGRPLPDRLGPTVTFPHHGQM